MRTWFAEKKKNIAEMLSQKNGQKNEGADMIKQEREELEKVVHLILAKPKD